MVLYGSQSMCVCVCVHTHTHISTSLQDILVVISIFIVLDAGVHWKFAMRVSGEGQIWIQIDCIQSLAISTILH